MLKKLKSILKRSYRQIISIFSKSIQESLGYEKNTKLLIIHADDMGLSGSENAASIESLERGSVNSGSVMVPCPGFKEIADYCKTHPNADVGIHLTLTSEWPSYKYGPVLSSGEVKSITDSNGFFFESKKQLIANANSKEIENEFRAQINKAIESGIELTHIDTHMFTAFSNDEILKIYVSLGKEYKLPVLLTYNLPFRFWSSKSAIVIDQLYKAKPADNVTGLDNYYRKVLNSMKPGLNCILVHVAYNDKEMSYITGNQSDFGSEWRAADLEFFTSNECRQLIYDNNIQLITWREIRQKYLT